MRSISSFSADSGTATRSVASTSSTDGKSFAGSVASVTTKYASSTVNVRAGAGTNYDAVAAVTRGTRLSVLSTANGWYQVSVPSKGVTGYISASYVSLGLSARTTGNVCPASRCSRVSPTHNTGVNPTA